MYCSDVARAFKRISSSRLLDTTVAAGVHPDLVALIRDWLDSRAVQVSLDGCLSDAFCSADMINQGNVLGPLLWNAFHAVSARTAAAC